MGRPAPLAQSAEHIHGKDGVGGSIPPGGSTTALTSGSSATACASGAGEVAATASALVGCSAGGSEGTAEIATVCRAGPCHVAASSEWRPCCATGYSYLSRRASRIYKSQTYRNGWAGLTVPLGSARAHPARYSRAREETGPRSTAQEAAWSMLQTIP